MRPKSTLRLRTLGALCAVSAVLCVGWAEMAVAQTRLWVEVPRATGPQEVGDFPFPPEPTPEALARRTARGRPDRVAILSRGPSVDALRDVEATGARIRRVSRWLSAVSVDADDAARRRLVARFGRDAVRPVASLRRPEPTVEPPGLLQRWTPDGGYGLSRSQITLIGLDGLHARGLTGEGVRVLVLDTGFRLDHPALTDLRVEATWDFVNGDPDVGNDPGEVSSQDRHGTGVVGIMAGFVPGDLVGPAPDARYLLAKTEFLTTETRAEEDAFVAALEWGEALGADVMNASLGYRVFYDEPDTFAYSFEDLDGDTAVTTRAVDDMVALGVVAVTSAGNAGTDGPGSLLTPADADSGLAIAAVDSNGVLANFSSRGPTADGRIKPDLAAQGVLVRWARTDAVEPTGWATGTSAASPLVASAVTLALQAHPEWGPGDVADALRATASQSGSPDTGTGWGIVDATAAVFDVVAPQTPLPFPLHEPADSSRFAGGETVQFRWSAAEDLQTPDAIDYRIEWADDPAFAEVVAVFEAGPDTARALVPPGPGVVWWRVVATDPDGNARVSSMRSVDVDSATGVPLSGTRIWARLGAPWPNPSGGVTTALLALDRPAAWLSVEVHDVAGRRIRSLPTPGGGLPGEWRIQWDGRDDAGRPTGSGVYFLRAVVRDRTGERIEARARVTRLR